MNTITKEQYSAIWNELYDYTEANNLPDFWTIDTLDAEGEQCSEEDAVYLEIHVEDFDYKHDFYFLRRLLSKHGVQVDEDNMLDFFDLRRLEREGEARPLKACYVSGSAINGEIYGYQLILKK